MQAARGIGVSTRPARIEDGGRGFVPSLPLFHHTLIFSSDNPESSLEPPPPAQRAATKPYSKKKFKTPEFIESSEEDDLSVPVIGSKRPSGDSTKEAPRYVCIFPPTTCP